VIDRSSTWDNPIEPMARYVVVLMLGTYVAETILASVQLRTHRQAGHMGASDLIKSLSISCGEGAVHIWFLVRPETMRSSTSVNQVSGSMSFNLHVYAARRTMPNGFGMVHGCRGAVGRRVTVGSAPFGIVQSLRAPPGRRVIGRWGGSGFGYRPGMA
jgi:hypothetical protein